MPTGLRGLRSLAYVLTGLCSISQAQAQDWTYPPFYVSPAGESDLSFQDDKDQHIELYSESYAILIIQANYAVENGWTSAVDAAKSVEERMKSALVPRHFNVLVWRDLDSQALRTVPREAFSRLGRGGNARLFFYYFGHGTMSGPDDGDRRFYLVPVDAPRASDEKDFREKAFSDLELRSSVANTNAKHTFLAFEACQSGGILGSLASLPRPANKLYLTSEAVQKRSKQYLTAGNEVEEIPADGGFSGLIIEALSTYEADVNDDKYITADEVTSYVSLNLLRRSSSIYRAKPEHLKTPGDGGDFIFGPVRPGEAPLLTARARTSDAADIGANTKSPRSEDTYLLSPSGDRVTRAGNTWKMISGDQQSTRDLILQEAASNSPDYEFWAPFADMIIRFPKSGGPAKRKLSGEQLWSEYGTATR